MMNLTNSLPGSLEEVALLQLEKLRELAELLEEERSALVESEAQDILSLSAKKESLISQLSSLEEQQSQYTNSLRTGLDRPQPDSQSLEALLQEIRTLSQECMNKNQLNGHLVASARSAVLTALDVVRNDHRSKLYSNLGVCEHEQGKKSLGTA